MLNGQVSYHRVPQLPGLVLSDARLQGFSYERHYHLDYHIGVVAHGVHRQSYAGATSSLGAGCIAFMPPAQVHDGRGDEHCIHVLRTFRVAPPLLQSVARNLGGKLLQQSYGPTLIENKRLAQQFLSLHAALAVQPVNVHLETLWVAVFEQLFGHLHGRPAQAERHGLADVDYRSVEAFCNAHLGEKIALSQLASLCDMSVYQFLRRFARRTGITPHAWLLRLRLEHAYRLLVGKSGSIADVATWAGFYDQSHFCKAFRSAYGVSPSMF